MSEEMREPSLAEMISSGTSIEDFVVKDSGKRQDYESGMRRDVEDDKPDFTLAVDGPMFERYAMHLTKGAKKYGRRNWQLANSEEEMERFKRSAFRHLIQWLAGDRDEDHAAAIMFNVNAAEYVRGRIDKTDWDKQAVYDDYFYRTEGDAEKFDPTGYPV